MMPTLAPGHRNTGNHGFTLIETLVVLLIISIAIAAVSLGTGARHSDNPLRQEARRLAHVLSLAHSQARAWGIGIQWRNDDQGYWFEPNTIAIPGSGVRLQDPIITPDIFETGSLRRRNWQNPELLRVDVEPENGYLLTSDWRSGPVRITLSDGIHTLRIMRTNSGLYEVVP